MSTVSAEADGPSNVAIDAEPTPDADRLGWLALHLRGLGSLADVVWALILRETRTRFGLNKLGYLWALLEPSIVIFTVWGFFRIINRAPPAGMDLFSFVATGVIPYNLFTNSVNRVADSIDGNKALLYYPQVRPIDLVIARSLLEFCTYIAVFIALLGGHALFTREFAIDSPLAVIGGMALASMLGTAFGLVFCGLNELSNLAERARGPIMRPLFWISGIYFTASTLPPEARRVMLWNPVLHVTELVREGWFETYTDDHVNVPYVLAWVLGLALVGLLLERAVRGRIEMT